MRFKEKWIQNRIRRTLDSETLNDLVGTGNISDEVVSKTLTQVLHQDVGAGAGIRPSEYRLQMEKKFLEQQAMTGTSKSE